MPRRCGCSTLRAGALAALACLVTVAAVRAPDASASVHRLSPAVFGFNYVRGAISEPERYFTAPSPAGLATIRSDLERMRRLGANVVRIYLQLPDFMRGPSTPMRQAFRALRAVLGAAQAAGVRLDVTGNLVWRPGPTSAWYDQLSEQERWRVQAAFWRAVARAAAGSPAVAFYELTSEPTLGGGTGAGWYAGRFGGAAYVQRIALDAGNRPPDLVARNWVLTLRRAIDAEDPGRPVTIGLLPNRDGAFGAQNMARVLDFLTLHVYPAPGHAADALATVRAFAATGKAVVIGETHQLYLGDAATERAFLLGCRGVTSGVLGFFDGRIPAEVASRAPADYLYRASLSQLLELRPALTSASR